MLVLLSSQYDFCLRDYYGLSKRNVKTYRRLIVCRVSRWAVSQKLHVCGKWHSVITDQRTHLSPATPSSTYDQHEFIQANSLDRDFLFLRHVLFGFCDSLLLGTFVRNFLKIIR